jgi:signal peptidase II
LRVLYITFLVVFADQVTKLFVKGFNIPLLGIAHRGMELNSTFEIIDDFLRCTFVENPGMAFGIDLGGKLFFSVFSIAAGIGILYYLFKVKKESLIIRVPLALILGGAIGNLIDRAFYGVLYGEAPLFFGRVVDFIDLKFFRMQIFGFYLTRWPVFNIADVAVTVGVLILIVFHKKISDSTESEKILQVPVPMLQQSLASFPDQAENSD